MAHRDPRSMRGLKVKNIGQKFKVIGWKTSFLAVDTHYEVIDWCIHSESPEGTSNVHTALT